jgi:hypothetical protein
VDSGGSGNRNKRRLSESVPQPRLASKERTQTWGTGQQRHGTPCLCALGSNRVAFEGSGGRQCGQTLRL